MQARSSASFQTLRLKILLLGLSVCLAAAALVGGRLVNAQGAGVAASPALAVSTLTTERVSGYALRRVLAGRVEPRRSSAVGFERAGRLEAVPLEEGDRVSAGQVVARLDSALLAARRKELQAALAEAEAKLALARSTLRRYRGSVDRGAVTRQALDEARAGERAAEASLELAQARLGAVDIELAKSALRAPFDAVVTRREADEGQVLAAGSPVLELQERAVPEVRVGVAGRLADGLQPGAIYQLHWRGCSIEARLRSVLPLRAAATRTVDALLAPLDAPPHLRAGDLVELELTQWVAEPGFWLPMTALAEGTRGLWQAYVTEPLTETAPPGLVVDHRIVPRPIEVLYLDGDRVYARGPLQNGEHVVRAGTQRVVPGQLVRVLGQSHLAMEAH